MTNKSAKLRNWRLGSIMALTAAAGFLIIGLTAMVTDVGYLYYSQARLQTAVNAAWKAGYDHMITLKQNSPVLNDTLKASVTSHAIEVMGKNGFVTSNLKAFQVTFTPPDGTFRNNYLRVYAVESVGMFFAKIFDMQFSDVVAMRENNILDGGQGIVPIAIPNGTVGDLGNIYSYDPFESGEGFASGTKYIIRLGTGGKSSVKTTALKEIYNPPTDTATDSEVLPFEMLLVRFDGLSEAEALAAYGAAYWCMRFSNDDVDTFVPVLWLMKNAVHTGGAFMFPSDSAGVVKAKLVSYGVALGSIKILSDQEPDTSALSIEYHLQAAGEEIVMLFNRPRVALYTNNTVSPIATVLKAAKIPFGAYGQPGGLDRNMSYIETSNTITNDAAVLAGDLSKYHVVLVDSNEDLTGNNYGCDFYTKTCEEMYKEGRFINATKLTSEKDQAATLMCPRCRGYFRKEIGFDISKDMALYEVAKHQIWSEGGVWSNATKQFVGAVSRWATVTTDCEYKHRRCIDRKSGPDATVKFSNNTPYPNMYYYQIPAAAISGVQPILCGDAVNKCGGFKALRDVAIAKGFTDSATQKPQLPVDLTGATTSITSADFGTWFVNANPVQKMKWAVADGLRNHIATYGHLFAHDLGAETLDLAIWQSALNKSAGTPYDSCLAFTGMTMQTYPRSTYRYSTINGLNKASVAFAVAPATDVLNQVLNDPITGSSTTATFNTAVKTSDTSTLGGNLKYLKGLISTGAKAGEFTFLAGNFQDVNSKRLLLNNILKGQLSLKVVSGGVYNPIIGKQKSGYGDIDPDNVTGGGVNDWQNNFMFGFNGPIEMDDHIMTDPGKGGLGGSPDPLGFRLYGGTIDGVYFPPNPYVILPIVEPSAFALAEGANTIYDLQSNAHPDGLYKYPDPPDGFENTVKVIGFAEFKLIPREEWDADNPDEIARLGQTQVNDGQLRAVFVRYIIKPEGY